MSHYASDPLFQKSKRFALGAVRLYAKVAVTPVGAVLGKQVLRSATSVGAHIREGRRGRSIAEMIAKAEVGLQELEESIYWFELLVEAGLVKPEQTVELRETADELMAMLVAGVKRLKQARAR